MILTLFYLGQRFLQVEFSSIVYTLTYITPDVCVCMKKSWLLLYSLIRRT